MSQDNFQKNILNFSEKNFGHAKVDPSYAKKSFRFAQKKPSQSQKIKPNMQDVLKFFALFSMLIDHLGLFFFEDSWIMRVVGRYAAVVFCFFVGYNYKRPEDQQYFCLYQKRFRSILLWGIFVHIVQVCTSPYYLDVNILVSLIINLCLLDLIKNYKIPDVVGIVLCAALSFVTCRIWDYGTFPASIMLLGLRAKSDRSDLWYSGLLYYSLMCLLIFEYVMMDFSPFQIFIIFYIFLGICYCLIYVDFTRKVKYRVFLLARFALPFYVIHITTIMVISYLYKA
ncbi:MAG: TraX family protein [Rickettsiaceae bacterium]|nr:TraX family protein [Rickettsiaceae bacterium]